jgi:hypothetical protein
LVTTVSPSTKVQLRQCFAPNDWGAIGEFPKGFRARRRPVHAGNSGGNLSRESRKQARLDEARWLIEHGESVHVIAMILHIKDRIF